MATTDVDRLPLAPDRTVDPLSGKTAKKKSRGNLLFLRSKQEVIMAKGTRSLADQLADFEDPTPKGMATFDLSS
jgi:hypothetical protein